MHISLPTYTPPLLTPLLSLKKSHQIHEYYWQVRISQSKERYFISSCSWPFQSHLTKKWSTADTNCKKNGLLEKHLRPSIMMYDRKC